MLSLPLTFLFSIATSHPLEKRSTDGSNNTSSGEIVGLVVGIIGVLIAAVTGFKGWECWRSRKDRTTLAAIEPPQSPVTEFTHSIHHYFHVPDIPGQNIVLEAVHRRHHGLPPAALPPVDLLQPIPSRPQVLLPLPPLSPSSSPLLTPSPPDRRSALRKTSRALTWPVDADIVAAS